MGGAWTEMNVYCIMIIVVIVTFRLLSVGLGTVGGAGGGEVGGAYPGVQLPESNDIT